MGAAEDFQILIVDDEPELREILTFDFETAGYDVVVAENSQDAQKVLSSHSKVKAIVSDIRMPNGDGVHLLRSIQDWKRDNNIVLVFLTGYADLSIDEAYELGADGFLAKPFNRRNLISTIERLLTPSQERWSKPSPLVDASKIFTKKLIFESFDQANQTHKFNLGRGGAFIADDKYPKIDEFMVFEIEFKDGGFSPLKGQGTVRWVRKTGDGLLPTGYGIEFQSLDDNSRKQIAQFIELKKPIAFIPKT
jgi:CheY-like chemotaxis protein